MFSSNMLAYPLAVHLKLFVRASLHFKSKVQKKIKLRESGCYFSDPMMQNKKLVHANLNHLSHIYHMIFSQSFKRCLNGWTLFLLLQLS